MRQAFEVNATLSSNAAWQDIGDEIKIIPGSLVSFEVENYDDGAADGDALTDFRVLVRDCSSGHQYAYVDGDDLAGGIDVLCCVVLWSDGTIKTLAVGSHGHAHLDIHAVVGIQFQGKATNAKTANVYVRGSFGNR